MTLALEYMGATTGFVLGRSRIGLDKLDADAIAEWLPALCDALNVAVNRGGQRDGLVDSLDVGTMTATFLDAMDPTTDDNVRPNTPIRLSKRHGLPVTRYTSAITPGDADGWLSRIGDSGPTTPTNTIAWPDGESIFVETDSSLLRSFAVRTPGRFTLSWSDAMSTGSSRGEFDVYIGGVLADRVTLAGTPTRRSITVDVAAAASSLEVLFRRVAPVPMGYVTAFWDVTLVEHVDAPIFTGVVQDAVMVDDRDGRRRVTLTAVDARASLSNTQRYGAISDAGAGSETWAQRINRLRASAQTSTAAPKVTGGPSPFLLRDVVYESTLANHFDLACNSVGARWWVDRRNLVQFEYGPPDAGPVIAHLSDEHDADDPMHVCYLDVELGYDTRNAINNLSLTNHGRRFDTEQATWLADDQTSVHEDVTAIASWGARSSSVDTSLYVGAGHEADVVIRAYQLLDGAVVPSVRPTSVRLDVAHGPHLLADLDYYSRVTLTRAGTSWACRVVGIEHEITPLDGHHITLTLREDT